MNDEMGPSPHSIEIAHSFLQTVVVVDDRALNPVLPEQPSAEPIAVGSHRAVVGGLKAPVDAIGDRHDLDAKRVSQAFASHGLVCGLLSPSSSEPMTKELVAAARRADLVVLDWVLDRDGGRGAKELLGQLLNSDSAPGAERLRAIAVYTGQSDLRSIAKELETLMVDHFTDHDLRLHDDGLAMTKGPVRLTVLAKENVDDLEESITNRSISPEELPLRLEREFAALTDGLVTAVALGSLAALRSDTHRILQVLGPVLDPGFLGHRTSLPETSDAEAHALELVSSELRSVLEDHEVGKSVALPVISEWLTRFRPGDRELGNLIDSSKFLTREQVLKCLDDGLGRDSSLAAIAEMNDSSSKTLLRKVKKFATKLYSKSDAEADKADEAFANRMILRTVYSTAPRILQLGTIVEQSPTSFLLCVQPLCDAARLGHEVKGFPFVRLLVTSSDSYQMRVLSTANAGVYLKLSSKPSDVVSLNFKPRVREQAVIARTPRHLDNSFEFIDTSNKHYRWVAELKTEFAQKAVGDLAAAFARVAVNEAEPRRLN